MHLLQHHLLHCSKCCKLYICETDWHLPDRFAEHLRSVRNNDVDKPVAWYFNTANHSISDIKVCAISPISGGNDSRKRQEKHLIFKIGTIHPHGLNEQFCFIWSLHSCCFCLVCADKSSDFSPLHSMVYWLTLKITNDLPIFASYYAFLLTWLAYFLSHDYLSFKFTRFFIYFLFLSDEGPMLETLDITICIGSTTTFLYFYLYLCSAYAAHYVYLLNI